MRTKLLSGVFLMLLVGVVGFSGLAWKSGMNEPTTRAKRPGKILLQVVQLPADGGIIPVAIQGESMSSDPENGMKEAGFVVRNNTSKNIDAVSVAVTGRIDRNGTETSSTGYLTINSFVHPDIREIHHQYPLAPGKEWSFKTEPLETEDTEAGVVLTGITLQIDYVDFEDRTELGSKKYGSNIVVKARIGAAKYKAWLSKKYAENGRSIAAVLPLLDRNQALPADIALGDHERTGARLYQSHLLQAYQQHGSAEVEKYLNRWP